MPRPRNFQTHRKEQGAGAARIAQRPSRKGQDEADPEDEEEEPDEPESDNEEGTEEVFVAEIDEFGFEQCSGLIKKGNSDERSEEALLEYQLCMDRVHEACRMIDDHKESLQTVATVYVCMPPNDMCKGIEALTNRICTRGWCDITVTWDGKHQVC